MAMDDIKLSTYTPRVYTDIQGVKQLQYSKDKTGAKKEIAHQFEAILMQMVLTSMRQANKAYSSGMFSSNAMDMYEDLFDKQLSLMMSDSNNGFASMVEKSIDQMQNAADHPTPVSTLNTHPLPLYKQIETKKLSTEKITEPLTVKTVNKKNVFATAEEFVSKLWKSAKFAAKVIGASPEFLLAQAALETNWGKSIIPDGQGSSTHNLFNIKAGSNWANKTSTVETLEQKEGVLVKEKAQFRSYTTYEDSFKDYVSLLQNNERYKKSVSKANKPEEFAVALQTAGYATDKNYANKIMGVYSNPAFQALVKKMKSNT